MTRLPRASLCGPHKPIESVRGACAVAAIQILVLQRHIRVRIRQAGPSNVAARLLRTVAGVSGAQRRRRHAWLTAWLGTHR